MAWSTDAPGTDRSTERPRGPLLALTEAPHAIHDPAPSDVCPRRCGKMVVSDNTGSSMQLASVRAVVTGGVSGLGLAVAQHLVAHGGKVSLFDVNDDKGAAAVEALGSANARYFRTDVTDEK